MNKLKNILLTKIKVKYLICFFALSLMHFGAHAGTCNIIGNESGAPVLCGVAKQGGMLFGEVPTVIRVYKGDVLVSYRGIFVVGLAYNTPETISLRFCQRRRCDTFTYNIEQRTFPEQHITVPARFDDFTPEVLARIERERQNVFAARAESINFDATAFMDMELPENLRTKRITAGYGFRRVVNGTPRRRHLGVDFAAPTGTPAKAIADGVITLADYMFFNGKSVYIKHGHGMSSSYMHLHTIDVNVGDVVKRGQVIGTIGNTGRSTGPHLHLGVYWRQSGLDPMLLLQNTRE
ncbi:MAG: M23 family metallopeptidase [Alphaproteobacteria bacterium]|nr:M23 family metallopeptidase [Alphaproteobacteria bacterium]